MGLWRQLRQQHLEEAVERQFGDSLTTGEYRAIVRQVRALGIKSAARACDDDGRGVCQSCLS